MSAASRVTLSHNSHQPLAISVLPINPWRNFHRRIAHSSCTKASHRVLNHQPSTGIIAGATAKCRKLRYRESAFSLDRHGIARKLININQPISCRGGMRRRPRLFDLNFPVRTARNGPKSYRHRINVISSIGGRHHSCRDGSIATIYGAKCFMLLRAATGGRYEARGGAVKARRTPIVICSLCHQR